MSDTPGPKTYPTQQIPRVENAVDAMLSELRAMRIETRESTQALSDKVDTLSANVDALQHDAKDTRARLGRMEREMDAVKDRQANNSIRARSTSEVDLKQDAALGMLTARVEELARTNAATGEAVAKLVRVAEHPLVRRIAYAAGLALLAWMASHGMVPR